jgi:hypothetical protein
MVNEVFQMIYNTAPIIHGNWGKQGPVQPKDTIKANNILLELSRM